MERVVITGASGYIGGMLAKRLLQEGVTVYGIGRNREKLDLLSKQGDFHPVIADFEDYDELSELINIRGFDRFYHFAWQGTGTSDHIDYNDYNVQIRNAKAACDAVVAAAQLECAAVSFCSSYQEADTVICETSGFNSVYYGIVKRCANELFKALAYKNNMSCVNLIFPNIYGVNDKPNTAIVFFLKNLLQDKPLSLISGDHKDDWMYVEDVVDGIIAASKSTIKYGNYYVGHRNITTFKEKLIEMKRILKSSSELNWGKYPENYYVDYNRFDLDALYHDTGWEAKTSFADSVLTTAEWIKTINQER